MFLYTNPVWPDNVLVSWCWAAIVLHSQPIFLKKLFRRKKYLNSRFISVLFIAALIGYPDSQMNWHLEWEFIWCQPRGRLKKKDFFVPRSVSFWRLWTSLYGRRKTCYKSVVLSTVGLNKCICKSQSVNEIYQCAFWVYL